MYEVTRVADTCTIHGMREAEKVLAGGGREGLRGLGYGMFYEGRWMLELGGWDGWKSLGFGYY